MLIQWDNSFKVKHNIKLIKTFGESGFFNLDDIKLALPYLIEKLNHYNCEYIYNFDETALFYRM